MSAIETLSAQAVGTVAVELVDIDPALAATLLSNNPRNRKPQMKRVEQYAATMTTDRWAEYVALIVVGTTGELVNGQHTLLAVVKSGKTIKAILLTGVDADKARPAMDTGMGRLLSHELQILKVPNSTQVAAIAILAHHIEGGFGFAATTDSKVSNFEMLDWIDAQRFLTAAAKVSGAISAASGYTASACGAFYLRARAHDKPGDSLELFIEGLKTGIDLPKDSPILAARKWIADSRHFHDKDPGKYKMPNALTQLAALTLAWDAWVQNKTLKAISVKKGNPFPEMYFVDVNSAMADLAERGEVDEGDAGVAVTPAPPAPFIPGQLAIGGEEADAA